MREAIVALSGNHRPKLDMTSATKAAKTARDDRWAVELDLQLFTVSYSGL